MGVHPQMRPGAPRWQLIAELCVQPCKRWGDADAPYGLGDLFASWQAQWTLKVVPPAGETQLLCQREAVAVSLTSDKAAVQRAIRKVVMEPDADWRITLATLWLHHLMGIPAFIPSLCLTKQKTRSEGGSKRCETAWSQRYCCF
jgi:hypothetical protein